MRMGRDQPQPMHGISDPITASCFAVDECGGQRRRSEGRRCSERRGLDSLVARVERDEVATARR